MILDNECEVKLNLKNKEHYRKFGYEVESKKTIRIKTNHLIPGSHMKVRVSCDICGIERFLAWKEYLNSFKNYSMYCCSSKCSQFKNRKTNLDRYGVDNPTKSSEILLKIKESNMNKYGVKSPLQLDSIKSRIKKTNLERYGFDNPTKNPEIYSKVKNRINEKYGNEVFFKTDYFRSNKSNYYRQYNNQNFYDTRKEYFKTIGLDLISVTDSNEYNMLCDKGHTYSIHNDVLYKRYHKYHTDICTVCNPIDGQSFGETDLYEYISSIYNGEIVRNIRSVISPYEIDIFLPEIGIAFEFNGIYWHSNLYLDRNYHQNKYKMCSDKGVSLVSVWEDDWNMKRDVVKSIIRNKIGMTKDRIYARSCKIIQLSDNKRSKNFLIENHLQGDCKSNIKIGLEYEGELVSLMTFSKNRYGVGKLSLGEYELSRYAVKKEVLVIGGASKILTFFLKNYEFTKLITFSDCDISDGDLYQKLGFDLIGIVKPTYYYIVDGKKDQRFKGRKANLVKKGLLKDNETEFQCMDRMNINRVYNSGHKKWEIYPIK